MVNSVSGVPTGLSFKANAMDKVTPELMSQPGAFSSPLPTDAPEKQPKKGGIVKAVANLLIASGLIVGGAVAARKLIPAIGKEKLPGDVLKEGATLTEKVGHYFAKYTDKVIEFATKTVPGFIKKAPIEETA